MTTSEHAGQIKNRKYFLPLVFIAAFLLLYAFTGYALHIDSNQYIAMHIRRDPLYPLFLALLRIVFGGNETACFTAAGIVQSVVNALGVWYFTDRMTVIFRRGRLFYACSVVLTCLPYLMTYLFSVTKINLIGDIMTEAFTYPLYLILFVLFLRMSIKLQFRETVISFLLCFTIVLLRGQLMSLIVVWALITVCGVIRANRGKYKRICAGLIAAAAALILFFTAKDMISKAYCHITSGQYITHPNAANMALAHVLYVSDREDAVYVPDEQIQELIRRDIKIANSDLTLRDLFLKMYNKMEKMQAGYRYEQGSFLERAGHMASFNDIIMFQVIEETYIENIRLKEYDYANLDLVENELSAVMMKKLMPEVFIGQVGWMGVYLRHVFYGIVRSIGIVAGALTWGVFVLYALAVTAMIAAFRKKKRVPALAMFLTLLLIAGIVTSTSFIHNCISRYVFYAFPCFYLSLTELFTVLVLKKENHL